MKKDIPGYEGLYYATSEGEVYSYDREYIIPTHNLVKTRKSRMLKKHLHRGYYYLTLCKNGKPVPMLVHRIIAKTFIKNFENKEQVNHKNGIKTDNSVKNLEWCTPQENSVHAYKSGLSKLPTKPGPVGEKSKNAKLSNEKVLKIKEMLRDEIKQKDIAIIFKVSYATISDIHLKRTWKHL